MVVKCKMLTAIVPVALIVMRLSSVLRQILVTQKILVFAADLGYKSVVDLVLTPAVQLAKRGIGQTVLVNVMILIK